MENPGLDLNQFQAAQQFANEQQVQPNLINTINQVQNADTQSILQPTPQEQAMIDAQKAAMAQPTEIGAQGNAALMPGLTQPINVGNYSGSIVGSNSIYVPTGNVYGWDVDLAKRKAEEDARLNKAKLERQVGTKWEPLKTPELTDKRFQENVFNEGNKLTSDFLKEVQEVYGNDYKYVLDNPTQFKEGREYAQKMGALNLLVDRGNQITDSLAEVRSSIDKGEKIYSEETLKSLNEYENLLGNFEKGDPNALLEMERVLGELEGGKALDNYFKDKGVIGSIKGAVLGNTSIGDAKYEGYAQLTDSDKVLYDNNIKNLVEGYVAEGGEFRNEFKKGLVTKESLEKRLRGYLQDEVVRKKKLSNVDNDKGGYLKIQDLEKIQGEPNNKKFINENGQESNFVMSNEVKLPTRGKKISSSGVQAVDADGNLRPLTGIKDMKVVSLNTVDNSIFNPEDSRFANFKDKKQVPVAVVEYEIEVDEMVPEGQGGSLIPSGKKITKTVQQPVLYDETLAKAVDVDAKTIGVQEGFGTQALKKLSSNNSEGSVPVKNIGGIDYTKEELINFAKEAGKTTKEAEELWNQQ